MATIVTLWNRFAQSLTVVAFVAMFGAFIVQIISRYVFNDPVAWTLEVCLIGYVWVVFWSSDILLGERQHIIFDVLYNMAPSRPRRVFALINTASLFVVFLLALPGTFDYVQFVARRRSTNLHIPMPWIYASFLIFVVAVVAGAAVRLWRLNRPGWEKQL